MIIQNNRRFLINTEESSYLFEITDYGHLKHLYYGPKLLDRDTENWEITSTQGWGCAILYSQKDPSSSLQTTPLEWSGSGCGDYRESPIEVESEKGVLTTDFRYQSHRICHKEEAADFIWPRADEPEDILEIRMKDPESGLELLLYWSVYGEVITRKTILVNASDSIRYVRKLMSSCMDLTGDYQVLNLHGDWIREAHTERSEVGFSRIVNESLTGFSSNQHNPAFAMFPKDTTEWTGDAYGFNLIYSGNHYASLAKSSSNLTRVMNGISPSNLRVELMPGDQMETPDSVMTYSRDGLNGMSQNFHCFVNTKLIPASWRHKPRPVLYNSWEGCLFDFNERKLFGLAKEAKKLGCELFVLDDGWFGTRNDDTQGLGDYNVNPKKLNSGLDGFADRINKLGMQFGLWFEPEAVNENSDLYRAHPDWVLREEERSPLQGRNEYLLDLRKECVRDYIVDSVAGILDSANISYVKWDMNRHSCILGAGSMEYIRGLYEVLHRIFDPRPQILLESCASGGNRFDLGMLTVSPQIWTSDNTDPIERLEIQRGISYFYPLSAMGCHVSADPHMQTLRRTSLETRANVAYFGTLGYEMDLDHCTHEHKSKIREQIRFYKQYQSIFQYGVFSRYDKGTSQEQWQVSDGDTVLIGVFRRHSSAAPGFDKIQVFGLDENAQYLITTRKQLVDIGQLGGMVNYVSPVKINPNGALFFAAEKRVHFSSTMEERYCSGAVLSSGFIPKPLFTGTGYDGNQRLIGEGGSELYVLQKQKEGKKQ